MLDRITRLICDDCGVAGPTALPDQSAVRLAKVAGWGTLKIDLCPKCIDIRKPAPSHAPKAKPAPPPATPLPLGPDFSHAPKAKDAP